MAVKTEKELSEAQRAHWLKAVAAIELRNFGYAITLLQGILRQEPEFLTARQLLRRTEITRAQGEKKSRFAISTAPLAVMKAQRDLKKEPRKVLEAAEKILEDDPYHRQANMLLKDAAIAAEMWETAAFALETLLEHDARDTKVLHELAKAHHALGAADKEVEIYSRIAALDPADGDAARMLKDASARASMKGGGWQEASSYRDLIADKGAAVSLEQQGRMQLAGESLDQQIADVYERHQAEPQNVALAQRLGVLHEQKDDLASAVAWFEYASQLTGGSDPGLVRRISELQVKAADQEIARLQAAGDDAGVAAATRQRATMLMEEVRRRVERNPTDLQLRFELGEQLMAAGAFREAVPELQRARQNPNARLRAMHLLGRCYLELGMLDLAVKQLDDAAREITMMDATKKDIVYELGLAYERIGDAQKSLDCMKQIYEADYGFRDVAARVESSYSSESPRP